MIVFAPTVHITGNHVCEGFGDKVQYRHARQFFLYRAVIVQCATKLYALRRVIHSLADAVTHGAGKSRCHTESTVVQNVHRDLRSNKTF